MEKLERLAKRRSEVSKAKGWPDAAMHRRADSLHSGRDLPSYSTVWVIGKANPENGSNETRYEASSGKSQRT
jgi:hypothetical protein